MNLLPRFSRSKLRCPMSALFLFLVTLLCMLTRLASAGLEQQQDGSGIFQALLGNTRESLPQLPDSVVGSQHLRARQLNATFELSDNSTITREIGATSIDYWTFSPSRLNVTAGSNLYLTLSVCTQPFPNPGLNATEVYATQTIPPLQLYVSTDASNLRPGPGVDSTTQAVTSANQGFANFTINSISSDIYLSIAAGNVTSDWQGTWTYSLGSSTFGPQQTVMAGENLFVIDTSETDALITTGNLSSLNPQPFDLFVVPASQDYVLSSLSNSYCAFLSNPSLLTSANANVSMTTRGAGGLPKQQFFLSGLNGSTEYNVYLTLPSSNLSNNGNTVFTPSASLETKSSDVCQLVFNLDFCSDTAYAAPGNPSLFDSSELATFYDSNASSLFTNFSITLQLYACNTTQSAQFSLFANCSTCLQAYKNWLCAVTIPRCTDSTENQTYLYPRPTNTSRFPGINEIIQPEAYNEILPCADLCWAIEQNCPSVLGFQCPSKGSFAMQNGYGQDPTGKTCNAPQLQYLASLGSRVVDMGMWSGWWIAGLILMHWLAFWGL